ncbi:acyl-ACP--UDP-N-acetylglucosamine O-acyltransferase [Orrella sp. NBD-18]|uniref:Acyl-[acyl-carrier-protein]--UDP-N-acetylglucosamine O-acyltransferase n=1 Tax=Sheuella amnicola TaxID=2707330 RepID=A0A6B2QXP7_9BURK|nr:acyl-ACP--UDP-N-acetylglucosamine O-acyltransferase [Sheuella amnicola]NDY81899.1 acyl-ACP--UDP-N-acetylglucosamine O-acyltransferase [Sheuella amnicola]HBI82672.1 acyl-[acyl-carrier-protein]--UDP-N-acetylglucosamine O-acyltransferase [Alcaligenaceae bacterium]
MSSLIHQTALVDPLAQLHPTVSVGPYSIIGPNVKIGAHSEVGSHCVIDGHTTIGEYNRFYRFCSIGGMPQDKKYAGEPTELIIGDRNMVREYVTINTGTIQDGGVTTVGSDNWIMAYVHIAHDCQIGSNVILANGVQMGGHVHIGDWAIVGGLAAVHQFGRIGAHSMTGGQSAVHKDIPPYIMSSGNPCVPVGINAEGLKRRGFSNEAISALRDAYKIIYRRGLTLDDARAELRARQESEPGIAAALDPLLDFLDVSTRGIIRP